MYECTSGCQFRTVIRAMNSYTHYLINVQMGFCLAVINYLINNSKAETHLHILWNNVYMNSSHEFIIYLCAACGHIR